MTKSEQLIARIKEVQLRGNTAPKNLYLLEEIIEHLREEEKNWPCNVLRRIENKRRKIYDR